MTSFLTLFESLTGDNVIETTEYFDGLIKMIERDFGNIEIVQYLRTIMEETLSLGGMMEAINAKMEVIDDELSEVIDLYDEKGPETWRSGYTDPDDTEYVRYKVDELNKKVKQ